MARAFFGILVLAAAVAATGCDNDVENQTPTTPPPTLTEIFTGSINVNGAMTHTFNTAAAGTLTATLSEVTPDPAVVVSFAIGTWNNTLSVCQQVIPNDSATQGVVLTGVVSGPGTLCVRVSDNGRLTEAINYTLTVVHP